MAKKPCTIGNMDFDSHKSAKAFCKELMAALWDQRVRVRKTMIDNRSVPVRKLTDRDFLVELVRRHPQWELKKKQIKAMSGTITGFAVGKIEFEHGPARVCFWLSTADEPKAVPFSAAKCIAKR